MSQIRIQSVREPLRTYAVASRAAAVLRLADAMGLVPPGEIVEALDARVLRRLARAVLAAGIGSRAATSLASGLAEEPEHVAELLEELEAALEESPLPEREWPALEALFGADRLARLLATSPASVRRYRSGSRPTPDDVADRLHFLAKVVGDLAGAYNEVGIRRWFERPRSALADAAPAELLVKGWSSDDSGPRRVRELARALAGSSPT